jgi:PAS domain-containing protein
MLIFLYLSETEDPMRKSKAVCTILYIILFTFLDIYKNKHPKILKIIFPAVNLVVGIGMALENVALPEFRMYESWILYYMLAHLICFIFSPNWKQTVGTFAFVKIFFMVIVSIKFDNVGLVTYGMISISIMLYTMTSMMYSKMWIEMLKKIIQNKNLFETIKTIFYTFPDGVIVQKVHDLSNDSIIIYANDTAHRQLGGPENLTGRKLTELDMKCNIIVNDNEDKNHQTVAQESTINDVLNIIVSKIDTIDQVFTNQIKLVKEDNESEEVYNIRSVKIKWNDSEDAYLHAFSNITYLKLLEKEKITNKLMHIMLSSVSHEFRTPLNSFSNALFVIELNQKALLSIIEKECSARSMVKIDDLKMKSSKFIKIGNISAKILLNLVEDILDFAKIEAGSFSLSIQNFVVQDLIDEITYIFESQ